MRIALDSTPLYGARTGIGVFCVELLDGLAGAPGVEPVAFAVTLRGHGRLDGFVPPGVHAASRPMAARPLRRMWTRLDWPPIEWWTGPVDVVHGTNYVVPPARRAAEVVTVHDLGPIRFPELGNADTRVYPTLVERAIRRGAWVHALSDFVACEIVEHFGADPERVMPVHLGFNGVGATGPGRDAAAGCALAGADRYVLALGTVEPRKNLPALVRAFDRLAGGDPDVRLVLAGPDGHGAADLARAVEAIGHRDRVVRLGWVTDDDRAALLRGATVFAYPSRYEGFGLPPLEAQSVGTAVVTTDAGALPEVAGDGACYVPASPGGDDRFVETLAEALAAVLQDDDRRRTLVEAGHRNAARFSWEQCVRGMIHLYERAADSR